MRLIQIGITVCDEQGNLPPDTCTWQFNFHFDVNNDMCAPDSHELLTKAGLDFDRHLHFGIDHEHFGEMLITSGLALFEDVKWISFHSGYDFGYLLKLVTCLPLPSHEYEFFELLHQWFPCVYDIKYLMRSCKTLKGGLQDVADDLQVSRIGQQHQAGSDSLLTASTFFKLRDRFFDGSIDDEKHLGCLYGFANTTSAVFLPSGSIVYQAHGVTTPGMQHAQAVVPTPLTPGSSAPLHSPMSSHVPAGRRAAEAA